MHLWRFKFSLSLFPRHCSLIATSVFICSRSFTKTRYSSSDVSSHLLYLLTSSPTLIIFSFLCLPRHRLKLVRFVWTFTLNCSSYSLPYFIPLSDVAWAVTGQDDQVQSINDGCWVRYSRKQGQLNSTKKCPFWWTFGKIERRQRAHFVEISTSCKVRVKKKREMIVPLHARQLIQKWHDFHSCIEQAHLTLNLRHFERYQIHRRGNISVSSRKCLARYFEEEKKCKNHLHWFDSEIENPKDFKSIVYIVIFIPILVSLTLIWNVFLFRCLLWVK